MNKDVYYFPHDSNSRNDNKLIAVRMKHGAEGYGIYFMIIEKLRECADYKCIKDYNVIAFDLRVDTKTVKSIIEDFGLFVFTEDGKYFYSESLLRRMNPMDELRKKRSDAGKSGMEKRWKSKGLQQIDNSVITNLQQIDNNKSKVKESRGKENKVEESRGKKETLSIERVKKNAAKAATLSRKDEFYNSLVPFVEAYGKEMIRAFFDYWSEMNKSGSCMRFEKQPTWEAEKRLATWAKRENYNGKSSDTAKRDATANSRKESVAKLAGLADGVLRELGRQKHK